MRKVTAGLFHSVDGVVEAPDQWQFDQFDDELGEMLGGVMARVDTVNTPVRQYLNRLSDLMFVLARYINSRQGSPDVFWTSPISRKST